MPDAGSFFGVRPRYHRIQANVRALYLSFASCPRFPSHHSLLPRQTARQARICPNPCGLLMRLFRCVALSTNVLCFSGSNLCLPSIFSTCLNPCSRLLLFGGLFSILATGCNLAQLSQSQHCIMYCSATMLPCNCAPCSGIGILPRRLRHSFLGGLSLLEFIFLLATLAKITSFMRPPPPSLRSAALAMISPQLSQPRPLQAVLVDIFVAYSCTFYHARGRSKLRWLECCSSFSP